ncbi:hypothetical protein [Rhizobium sp. L1K21]|uniref:hypothetical protein n=1 Tax=Rhizobium sp. L1K21 TaxID=2954933 RepID=UPI0020925EBE|nr:hypothetical protein [Rhizobium sp. L1K21]MCO6187238.1 hypothetical protein [Rhizobium sp. L1K21]
MLGYAKHIAAAFLALATVNAAPAMAFGLGSMTRTVGMNVQSEIVVAKTGSIRPSVDNRVCMGAIARCGPKENHFSDFVVTFLNVKAREIEAVRKAISAQEQAYSFSPVWNVIVPFEKPELKDNASPFMIQQIWL